jgi:sugar-specific transcriptional regulator TrmB
MDLEILRKIGLSDGEIRVYSALLDTGKTSLNRIHEKTGIERRNIYDILNKLIERGLVTYITENRRRLFQVSHPNKILNYISEKEANLEAVKKDVANALPAIMEKYNYSRPDINAEIFRGVEGVKAVFEDMLDYKEMFWIGSGRYIPKKIPVWWKHWQNRRIKAKKKWYNLLRYELKGKEKPMEFEEIRFLPKEFSGSPVVFGVYGNKVINMLLGEEFNAFVIESKELADGYRRYHKYLWDNVAEK